MDLSTRGVVRAWLHDQRMAYAALVAGNGSSNSTALPVRRARGFLEENQGVLVEELSATTTRLLAAIPPPLRRSRWGTYDFADLSEQCERAVEDPRKPLTKMLSLSAGARSLLLSHRGRPSLFCDWLRHSLWRKMPATPQLADWLDDEWRVMRELATPSSRRVRMVSELYERSILEVPALSTHLRWRQMVFSLLSAQYDWPLLVERDRKATGLGFSLPIDLTLVPRSAPQEVAVEFRGADTALQVQGWDTPMRNAFACAKSLWLSQHRHQSRTARQLVRLSTGRVDFSVAERVVETFHDASHPLALEGRSAEAHFAQVFLARMVPGGVRVAGVATATLERDGMEWTLGEVEGLPAKLRFANLSGLYSTIVLAKSSAAVKVTSAMSATLERIDRGVETPLCATARSAADAMQPVAWRRAIFANTGIAARDFYRVLGDLSSSPPVPFPRASAPVINLLDARQRDVLDRSGLLSAEKVLVRRFRDRVGEQVVQIKVDSAALEPTLGAALAYVDADVRRLGFRALQVLCVRAAPCDSAMRFWSYVFSFCGASEAAWRQFQWGDARQAAAVLKRLLDNARLDPAISDSLCPDLLVVIDDGAPWADRERRPERPFASDFRGEFHELFGALAEFAPAPRFDAGREEVLGRCRILIARQGELPSGRVPTAATLRREWEGLAAARWGIPISAAASLLHMSISEVRQGPLREHAPHVFEHRGLVHVAPEVPIEGVTWEHHARIASLLVPLAVDKSFDSTVTSYERQWRADYLQRLRFHMDAALNFSPASMQRSNLRNQYAAVTRLLPVFDWDVVFRLKSLPQQSEFVLSLVRKLIDEERATNLHAVPHFTRLSTYLRVLGEAARDATSEGKKALLAELDQVFSMRTQALASVGADEQPTARDLWDSSWLYAVECARAEQNDASRAASLRLDERIDAVWSDLASGAIPLGTSPVKFHSDWARQVTATWTGARLHKVSMLQLSLDRSLLFGLVHVLATLPQMEGTLGALLKAYTTRLVSFAIDAQRISQLRTRVQQATLPPRWKVERLLALDVLRELQRRFAQDRPLAHGLDTLHRVLTPAKR